MVLVAAPIVLLAESIALAEPGFSAVQVIPGQGGDPSSSVYFNHIACASTTSCTAIGRSAGTPEVATESSGVWGATTAIVLPAGAVGARLDAISCPSTGNCVTVGLFYPTSSVVLEPMIVSESSGLWSAATSASPPPDALTGGSEVATFSGAWCASAGNCVVVGRYATTSGTTLLMSAAEVSGTWGATNSLPAVASSDAFPGSSPSVSCTSTGNCFAVAGPYVWPETAGTWGSPMPIAASPGPPYSAFYASDIACASATKCIAVGDVSSYRNTQSAAVTESSGTWSAVEVLPTPKLSPYTSVSGLSSISCQPTVCMAVGTAASSYDPKGQDYPIAATWSGGSWSSMGIEQVDPAGSGQGDGSGLSGVSCASPTQCLGIGRAGVFTPSGGFVEVYSYSTNLTPVRAVVAPGAPDAVYPTGNLNGALVAISLPSDDGGAPVTSFTATAWPGGKSCTSATNACEIAGLSNGHRYVVTAVADNGFASSPPVVSNEFIAGAIPGVPAHIRVAASRGTASISWHRSTSPSGEPVVRYLVHVQGRGGDRATATPSCFIKGLIKGHKYVVTVAAVNASGRSLPGRFTFVAK